VGVAPVGWMGYGDWKWFFGLAKMNLAKLTVYFEIIPRENAL